MTDSPCEVRSDNEHESEFHLPKQISSFSLTIARTKKNILLQPFHLPRLQVKLWCVQKQPLLPSLLRDICQWQRAERGCVRCCRAPADSLSPATCLWSDARMLGPALCSANRSCFLDALTAEHFAATPPARA